MPRKSKGPYLYTRSQGGQLRFYADLRSAAGGREAMIPEGERQATADPVVAQRLFSDRLAQLQEQRRDQVLLGVRRRAGLESYAAEHLLKKAQSGRVTDVHIAANEAQIRAAVEFFGADREVASIRVEDVQGYVAWLARRSNGRGGTLSSTSQHHYLSALSNLFRRAQGEGLIRGVNPVSALMDKPALRSAEAAWLETWEAALLLEAARTFPYEQPETARVGARLGELIRSALGATPDAEETFLTRMREAGKLASAESLAAYVAGDRIPARDYLETAARVLEVEPQRLLRGRLAGPRARPSKVMYPLMAALLLTGGRRMEVFGLELGDVSFARGVVTIRPNRWRRLKNAGSRRHVPLWPQLGEILEPWDEERRGEGAADDDLLFPSPRTGELLDNVNKALDVIAKNAGWNAGEIRPKAFRHTYASARVQTLDRGAPVSDFVVAKEMGHGGFEMVKRVYGHLGQVRHRSEEVEYRIEQHRESIPAERLRALLRVA